MVATAASAPSWLAGPPTQGRRAFRSAFDGRGAPEVLAENVVFEQLAHRPHRAVAASCIGRARPHRRDTHQRRCRFSSQTRNGRYSWARYYHPTLQRFISEDPIGFAGGDVNLYAYVFNAPLTFLDPLGLRIDLSMSSPELNRALELVKRTKRGRELYDAMDRDSRTCQIVSLRGFQNAARIRGTCNIVIDPDFHPEIPTLAGRKSASTARILAHEMGHAATNVGDTGPGQMDNIILNENPVVTELGLSPRTGYTVPSWWYLPFIGYSAPSGVEVPRR